MSAVGEGTLATLDGRIDCGSRCAAAYRQGSLVTVTASPGDPFQFQQWTAGCVGTSPSCGVALDQATTVRAEFVRIPQTVTVTVGGPGNVVSDPAGLRCGQPGGACAASFGQGSVIRLTPVPNADATFVGWGGPCQAAPLAGCDLPVGVGDEVTATFRHSTPGYGSNTVTVHTSSIQSSPAGIMCGPAGCSGSFDANTPVTLTGGQFWFGACVGQGNTCTVVPDVPLDIAIAEGGTARAASESTSRCPAEAGSPAAASGVATPAEP